MFNTLGFKECGAPDRGAIALNDPNVGQYAPLTKAQYKYWLRMYAGEGEIALSLISKPMLDRFDRSSSSLLEEPNPKDVQLSYRQQEALGITAATLLIRQLLRPTPATPNILLVDGVGHGHADLLLDVNSDPAGKPRSARIHVPTEAIQDIAPDTWYQTRSLYIRSSMSEPTPEQQANLIRCNVTADFDNLTTLFTYLKSRDSG